MVAWQMVSIEMSGRVEVFEVVYVVGNDSLCCCRWMAWACMSNLYFLIEDEIP
jgi:hypothetical protein